MRNGRAFAAWGSATLGVAFLAALAVGACSQFSAEDPIVEGGAPDGPGDGAPSADAPAADAAGDADAAKRWCQAQPGLFLCDDFDDPTTVGVAPWNRLDESDGGGSAKRDSTKALSLPTSFLVNASALGHHLLQKTATVTGKHLLWAFDMFIEDLSVPSVTVAQIDFSGGNTLVFTFFENADTTLDGYLKYTGLGPQGFVMPALKPKLNEWVHVAIDHKMTGASDEFRITIGAGSFVLFSKVLPTGTVALGLGASLENPGTATVRFDNVTMLLE